MDSAERIGRGSNILGIDVGSVSISMAEIGPGADIIETAYARHYGRIREKLSEMLFGFHLSRIGAVAATSSTPTFVLSAGRYDNRLCTIISCRRIHLNFSAILMAGAESLA